MYFRLYVKIIRNFGSTDRIVGFGSDPCTSLGIVHQFFIVSFYFHKMFIRFCSLRTSIGGMWWRDSGSSGWAGQGLCSTRPGSFLRDWPVVGWLPANILLRGIVCQSSSSDAVFHHPFTSCRVNVEVDMKRTISSYCLTSTFSNSCSNNVIDRSISFCHME